MMQFACDPALDKLHIGTLVWLVLYEPKKRFLQVGNVDVGAGVLDDLIGNCNAAATIADQGVAIGGLCVNRAPGNTVDQVVAVELKLDK